MKIERSHINADRYAFDFNTCTTEKGYAQVDTSQDASYFGTWANPETLKIVNYCEGDLTVQTCETPKEFSDELRNIKDWNERAGHKFRGIDPGFNKPLKKRFVDIGLEEFLH